MDDAEPIRLLIADDNSEFRSGLRGLLATQQDVTIVGEAATGTDALALAARMLPDVVLMDLQMPDLNGIDATRRLVSASPHIGVLVLTMFEDDESVFAAMRAGARGYLPAERDVAACSVAASPLEVLTATNLTAGPP
jgi:DNA-binding NarL/FixJ family response regulator